jgi:hypothetical protein
MAALKALPLASAAHAIDAADARTLAAKLEAARAALDRHSPASPALAFAHLELTAASEDLGRALRTLADRGPAAAADGRRPLEQRLDNAVENLRVSLAKVAASCGPS